MAAIDSSHIKNAQTIIDKSEKSAEEPSGAQPQQSDIPEDEEME